MLTVTSHLSHAIGVVLTPKSSEGGDATTPAEKETFSPVLLPETAVPVRRSARYAVKPTDGGGDVLVRICEGERRIEIEQPKAKPKINGEKKASSDAELDSDNDDNDDEDKDEEETRTKIWRSTSTLAELTLKDVGKDQSPSEGKKKRKASPQVEVTINVGADLAIEVMAREVGGKGGIRGRIDGGGGEGTQQNGSV